MYFDISFLPPNVMICFCHYVSSVVIDVITFPVNLKTTSGLSILLHGVFFFSQARLHMMKSNNKRVISSEVLKLVL